MMTEEPILDIDPIGELPRPRVTLKYQTCREAAIWFENMMCDHMFKVAWQACDIALKSADYRIKEMHNAIRRIPQLAHIYKQTMTPEFLTYIKGRIGAY